MDISSTTMISAVAINLQVAIARLRTNIFLPTWEFIERPHTKIIRNGSVRLNRFPRFINQTRAGWLRCRVVHGSVRRLRRTQRLGGQLGAHRRTHLTRSASVWARLPRISPAESATQVSNVDDACCTSRSNRQCRPWPRSRCRKFQRCIAAGEAHISSPRF